MEKNKVIVLSTGGTIEKSYCEIDGALENRESLFKEKLLCRLRLPHVEVVLREIMAKDSLDLTPQDREVIWRQVESHAAHGHSLVVLHGTDTMEISAKYCFEKEPNPPVAVVFTGAMRPAGFEDSDARQNFTEALILAQNLRPGFYLSFHGHLFSVPNVRKNKSLGTFECAD